MINKASLDLLILIGPVVLVLALRRGLILYARRQIVAPALDPGVDKVTAYLPPSRWVHLWSGESTYATQGGSAVTVPAPLGQPGVFYREGSPVAAQLIANLQGAGVLY